MCVLKTHPFEHAGRRFEIRAETHGEPSYVEAVIYENGSPARVVYPGGLMATPTYGASFSRDLGSEDGEAIDALIARAEGDFRRLTPASLSQLELDESLLR
jgi:hypothetical protein